MNQRINELLEILKGEYIPIEDFSETSPDLKRKWVLCNKLDDEFSAGLSEQLKDDFNVISQEHYNLIQCELSRIYAEGFRYGIKYMLSINDDIG